MRYLDAQTLAGSANDQPLDSWHGEPPAQLDVPTPQQLFAELDRDLQGVDVVRVGDRGWLRSDAFQHQFELLMSSFRARGGRVEYL